MRHAFGQKLVAIGVSVSVGCVATFDRSSASPPPQDGVQLGMFYDNAPTARGIADLEARIGDKQLASVHWFMDWGAVDGCARQPCSDSSCEGGFPSAIATEVEASGAIPYLTWEAQDMSLADILSGCHDDYITRFCADGAAWGGPIQVRLFHEMNGSWYPWSGKRNGGPAGPEQLTAAWRHVVDVCREAGNTNFLWTWCPHMEGPTTDVPGGGDDQYASSPTGESNACVTDADCNAEKFETCGADSLCEAEWNALERYWPGASYVDWMCIDGYNWYTHDDAQIGLADGIPDDPWGGQRRYFDFEQLFGETYDRLYALPGAAGKPTMIGELATAPFTLSGAPADGRPRTKAEWITDMFARLEAYPGIKMISWFNIDKERDWRIDSSPESLDAFQQAVDAPYIQSTPDPLPTVPVPPPGAISPGW